MTEKRNNCFYHHRNTYHTYKRKIRFMAIQSDTKIWSAAARAVLFKDGIKNLLRFFTVLCIPAFSSCPHGFQNRFQTFPKSVKRYSTRGGTSAYTWRLTPRTTRKHPRVLLPPLEKNSNFFVVSLSVAEHFEMCPTNKKAANLFRVFCFICRCRRRTSWFLLWFRVKNGCLYIGNISDLPQITVA